jgi:hypothetical protein
MVQHKAQTARAVRLRKARKKHFKSMEAAAHFHEWSVGTFMSHEKGVRAFKYERAVKYAKAFCVDIDWLWYGREAESKRLLAQSNSVALASQEPSDQSIDRRWLESAESFLQFQTEAVLSCESMIAHAKDLVEHLQRAIAEASRLRALNCNLSDVARAGQDG